MAHPVEHAADRVGAPRRPSSSGRADRAAIYLAGELDLGVVGVVDSDVRPAEAKQLG
jgi:hypothetical protein